MIDPYIGFMVITALMMMGIDSSFFIDGVCLYHLYSDHQLLRLSIERVVYRPVARQQPSDPIDFAIGMSIFCRTLCVLVQGSRDIAMPALVQGGIEFGSAISVSYMQINIFVVTFISMYGLSQFYLLPRMGCCACAEDIKMANRAGYRYQQCDCADLRDRAALASIAGILLGLYYGVINPSLGFYGRSESLYCGSIGWYRFYPWRQRLVV